VASNTVVSDPGCGRQLGHASWGVSVAGIIISVITIIIVVAVVVSAANEVTSTAPKTSCYGGYTVGGSCYYSRSRKYYYTYCTGYTYNGYCYY